MAVIEKKTIVDAQVETVFDYVEDPMHIPEYGPGVGRVEVLQRTDEGLGDSWRLIYSVIGIDFPMTFVATARARPITLVSKLEGAMSGEFRWDFRETEPGRTEVTLRVEYEVKGGAAGRAVDSLVVERMNDKNAARMLENVKQRTESISATGV